MMIDICTRSVQTHSAFQSSNEHSSFSLSIFVCANVIIRSSYCCCLMLHAHATLTPTILIRVPPPSPGSETTSPTTTANAQTGPGEARCADATIRQHQLTAAVWHQL